jgi:transmembrane sensor
MSEPIHFDAARQARRISEQAVAWYIEQQEPLSERQRVAFLHWLRASPKHVAEYFAVAQMHGDLKAAAALEKLSAAELAEQARCDNPIVMFPRVAHAPHERDAQTLHDRRVGRWFAAAAGVAATVVMGWLGMTHWRTSELPSTQYVAQSEDADAGKVHSLKLADGTLVQLDRHSAIDVHFDNHYRRIDVIRGHALFDVGKDPARPMLVNVGGHVLQDIGTVFDVKRDASGDTLTVISGRVRVLNGTDTSPLSSHALADLTAGQQIEFGPSGVGLVHPAQLPQATAWLPAEIRFQRETIGDVARRFNAYTSKPLVIEDDAIAGKRISGIFHANNPQAFVAYLSTLPQVRVIEAADRIRVVASR